MKHYLLIFSILFCGFSPTYAQLGYRSANAQNTTGTYVDLGTTGTVITVANNDNATSAPLPIGFNFTFADSTFSQFVLNTNGFIKLGNAPASSDTLFFGTSTNYVGGAIKSSNPADVYLISPLNHDLDNGDTLGVAEYRYLTSGTAPNRVLTVQYKNVRDKTIPTRQTQFRNMNFQIKLFEASRVIEFVYGEFIPTTAGGSVFKSFAVGLKGSSPSADNYIYCFKGSTSLWTATQFFNDTTLAPNANQHNIQRAFNVDAGRTYRFVPTYNNDAAVTAIYTLGKLPKTVANPHVISARVQNVGALGMTNITARLSVSGANTFLDSVVIPSIPINGATVVSFAGFSPTMNGTNTITVNIGNDDFLLNNTSSTTQLVSDNEFSYIEPGTSNSSAVGFGAGTTAAFYCRYDVQGSALVTEVRAFLTPSNSQASFGNSVFARVVDSLGIELGRSAPLVLNAGNTNAWNDFTISYNTFPIPSFTNQALFVGIVQTASTTGTQYFPMGFQNEDPVRPNSPFYTGGLTAAPAQSFNARRLMIEATIADPNAPNQIGDFSLIGPANNTLIPLQGNGLNSFVCNWERAIDSGNAIVSYQWLLDQVGNDFSAPLLSIQSNNGGLDTAITINYQTIDEILAQFGFPIDCTDDLDFIWTVRAVVPPNARFANDTFNITLRRCGVLCVPGNTSNTNDFIDSVSIVGELSSVIAKKTGRNIPTNYLDFYATDSIFTFPGQTYPFSVKMGTSIFYYRAEVYVDWNGDNTFDDANGFYITNTAIDSTNGALLTGNILVPTGQAFGTYRMRVIAGDTTGVIDPCNVEFGDIEDYKLIVADPAGLEFLALESSSNISLFPNPARDQFFITGAHLNASSVIQLVTMSGSFIKIEPKYSEGVWSLDVGTLPQGIYLVRVTNKDNSQILKVIIE